jgi:hypothetical protein
MATKTIAEWHVCHERGGGEGGHTPSPGFVPISEEWSFGEGIRSIFSLSPLKQSYFYRLLPIPMNLKNVSKMLVGGANRHCLILCLNANKRSSRVSCQQKPCDDCALREARSARPTPYGCSNFDTDWMAQLVQKFIRKWSYNIWGTFERADNVRAWNQ